MTVAVLVAVVEDMARRTPLLLVLLRWKATTDEWSESMAVHLQTCDEILLVI